jgi:hypothetical protein
MFVLWVDGPGDGASGGSAATTGTCSGNTHSTISISTFAIGDHE